MKQILTFLLISAAFSVSAAEPVEQASARTIWVAAITEKLKATVPAGMDSLYSSDEAKLGCTADIHLLTTGQVYDVAFPKRCSSHQLENAISWVVHGAQPLPLPSNMSTFQSHIFIHFYPGTAR